MSSYWELDLIIAKGRLGSCLSLVLIFEIRPHYVAQAGLELLVPSPLLPESWVTSVYHHI